MSFAEAAPAVGGTWAADRRLGSAARALRVLHLWGDLGPPLPREVVSPGLWWEVRGSVTLSSVPEKHCVPHVRAAAKQCVLSLWDERSRLMPSLGQPSAGKATRHFGLCRVTWAGPRSCLCKWQWALSQDEKLLTLRERRPSTAVGPQGLRRRPAMCPSGPAPSRPQT